MYKSVKQEKFPKKKLQTKENILEKRQKKLSKWLNGILNNPDLITDQMICDFLAKTVTMPRVLPLNHFFRAYLT